MSVSVLSLVSVVVGIVLSTACLSSAFTVVSYHRLAPGIRCLVHRCFHSVYVCLFVCVCVCVCVCVFVRVRVRVRVRVSKSTYAGCTLHRTRRLYTPSMSRVPQSTAYFRRSLPYFTRDRSFSLSPRAFRVRPRHRRASVRHVDGITARLVHRTDGSHVCQYCRVNEQCSNYAYIQFWSLQVME